MIQVTTTSTSSNESGRVFKSFDTNHVSTDVQSLFMTTHQDFDPKTLGPGQSYGSYGSGWRQIFVAQLSTTGATCQWMHRSIALGFKKMALPPLLVLQLKFWGMGKVHSQGISNRSENRGKFFSDTKLGDGEFLICRKTHRATGVTRAWNVNELHQGFAAFPVESLGRALVTHSHCTYGLWDLTFCN